MTSPEVTGQRDMAKLVKVSLLPEQQKSEAVGMVEKPAKENPGSKAKG